MSGHFGATDWVVLSGYFAVTMSVGFYFYRKSRSTEGFTAAGRSLPGWVCGLSIFATYLSSISFLALPGSAYGGDWNRFVFSLSLPIATWAAVKFFLPYYRRSGEVSAYGHLEKRFGAWARVYASGFYLLTQLARMGTVMYLMALPLSILLGVDIRTVIVITGVSVTIYAFVGGIVAVIWADAIQAMVLMGGAVVCAVIMLAGMPEGPGQVFAIAAQEGKFSLGSFEATFAESTFWVVLLYGIVMNLQNFGIDQSYVQRYIASKSDREARKSVLLGGLLYVPVSALFLFIGTELFAYYRVHPESMEEVKMAVARQAVVSEGVGTDSAEFGELVEERRGELGDEKIGDKVFPHFIGARLPAGATGLLIAAIFAAGMSTVSTSLNSSATLVMTDWYKRFVRKDASERQSMRVLYFTTVVWGLLGTGVAFLLIEVTSALDAWWKMSGIFGGGMLGLFLLGMISRRAKNAAGVTGVVLGMTVILWMTVSPGLSKAPAWLRCSFHASMIPVVGTLVILLAGLAVTKIAGRKRT